MLTAVQLQPESVATHVSAWEEWRARRSRLVRNAFRPAPRLTVSQWADRYRKLSKDNSAEPGQWQTGRTPYLREIMDTMSDPEVEEMVIMKSAQVGATEGIINNAIGYYVDQDPAPIMVVQPGEGDAEDFSKNKLAPMIRDTPRLQGKIADAKSRDSGNTILAKTFLGGSLTISGATSPRGLRRKSVRIALCDEVDGYPTSAGTEGDPIKLVSKRLTTFWNRLLVLISTPTIKNHSRIEKAFARTDKRYYFVPCPHCGAFQTLKWGGKDTPHGVKWDREEVHPGDFVDRPETAYYLCEANGCVIEERHKPEMIQQGEWRKTNPDSKIPGWHINALISPFDGAQWPKLVAEFLDAKNDPELLKPFVNTVLGETWEDRTEKLEPEQLEKRREKYAAEVPADVGVLTAAVDVQSDRLELLVVGWGAREESWRIAHHRIIGDPEQDDVWQRLENLRTRAYAHESGAELRIRALCIDSGALTTSVYKYVRPRQGGGVYATKGMDARATEPLKRASRPNKYGVKLWSVGTFTFKDILFRRLRIQNPGPGYMHFCQQQDDGFDGEYFAQFGAEVVVTDRVGGRLARRYKQVRPRNEAIDLEVLALVGLHTLGAGVRNHLETTVAQVKAEGEKRKRQADPEDPEEAIIAPPPRSRGRKRGGGWVQGWR